VPASLVVVPPYSSLPGIEVLDRIDERATFVHRPEVATSLVFRTTAEGRSDLIVLGPRSRGLYSRGKAVRVCVRAPLRPGRARALLGVSPAEIVDRAVPLTRLWGPAARRLADSWAGAEFDVLVSHISDLVGADEGDTLVDAAMNELTAPLGVNAVAARLGVSERHLRTVFAREVGLSPKQVARIQRVRRVLSLAGHRDWAEVAGDAGFFDQAHMITDFRAMMGVPPGAFLAGRLPPATACTPDQPPAPHNSRSGASTAQSVSRPAGRGRLAAPPFAQ
jgi:AraC-like DNA-binding protein